MLKDLFSEVFWYALIFSAVLYFPVSYLYLLYIKSVLMIYQELGVRSLYKNNPEQYTFVIENDGILPIGGIYFKADNEITKFGNDFTLNSFELVPRQKKEIETTLSLKYAGSYEAGITEIVIKDVLGILRLKYHIKAPLRVHVLPSVSEIADKRLNVILEEMTNGRRIIAGSNNDDNAGNELKSYSAGDPIKQIHWKNYARTGDLFVRLPEPLNVQMPTILLLSEPFDNSLSSVVRRDYFIEYAVSIANYFAKRKKPVSFIMGGHADKRMLVDDYESFQRFYLEITKGVKYFAYSEEKQLFPGEEMLMLKEKDNELCLKNF